MTGGKAFRENNYTLGVLFKGCAKANYVTIYLNGMDTYDMTFFLHSSAHEKAPVHSIDNLYCDQIEDVFSDFTGLRTSL